MTQPRLDFIRIGLMGDPMTRRLLAADFDVTVWNRSPDTTARLRTLSDRRPSLP
ncbi:MAG: NAD(P)-binding domain-containing protein [Halomonas sp.]|nr:NAD(P)-binding domain-containing protein [Halomonas sp.]